LGGSTEDGGLAGVVQPDYYDLHLLLACQLGEELAEKSTHYYYRNAGQSGEKDRDFEECVPR
jgi:hypothetical protein